MLLRIVLGVALFGGGIAVPQAGAPQRGAGTLVIPFTPSVTLRLGMTEQQVMATLADSSVSMVPDSTDASKRMLTNGGSVSGRVVFAAGRLVSATSVVYSGNDEAAVVLGHLPREASCNVVTEHTPTARFEVHKIRIGCPGRNTVTLTLSEDGVVFQEDMTGRDTPAKSSPRKSN